MDFHSFVWKEATGACALCGVEKNKHHGEKPETKEKSIYRCVQCKKYPENGECVHPEDICDGCASTMTANEELVDAIAIVRNALLAKARPLLKAKSTEIDKLGR